MRGTLRACSAGSRTRCRARCPKASGVWDEVLAALHRLRARRGEARARPRRRARAHAPRGAGAARRRGRSSTPQTASSGATAPPRRQLGLDGRADLGQNIANLVREPEFVEYLRRSAHDEPVRIARGPAHRALAAAHPCRRDAEAAAVARRHPGRARRRHAARLRRQRVARAAHAAHGAGRLPRDGARAQARPAARSATTSA